MDFRARARASLPGQDAALAPKPRPVRRCRKEAFLAIFAGGGDFKVAPPPVEEGQGAAPVGAAQEPFETTAPPPELAADGEPTVTPGESVDVNDVGWTILQAVLPDLSLLEGEDVLVDLELE